VVYHNGPIDAIEQPPGGGTVMEVHLNNINTVLQVIRKKSKHTNGLHGPLSTLTNISSRSLSQHSFEDWECNYRLHNPTYKYEAENNTKIRQAILR
jgi:hypothetical protein